ncbi:MAG: NADH-quinone oxidoreductase subunit A [Pseudomonadota bacterium]|nr:NADH-quinone oxidoreductase subunit A [Pseudomonadota bacterium]
MPILILMLVAAAVGFLLNVLSRFAGPRRPSKVKYESYECGVPTDVSKSGVRENMSVKYYVTALLFILFDIETVFLFLWAKIFSQLGWFGIVEVFIFLVVLLCGYVYVLKARALEWD